MAKGFKKEEANNSKGYQTIFEKVKEQTGGEDQSWEWYRRSVKKLATKYKNNEQKFNLDERRDKSDNKEDRDENQLRRYARVGRLFLFEYKAKMKYLPYYDTFPLVYVVKANADHFFGANLHYIHPRKRLLIIDKLKQNRIDIPRICFHKYITDHIDGFLLDLAIDEWDTAIHLPVEHFVTEKNGLLVPYKSSEVWQETNKKYNDRVKAKRIIRGYGNPSDIEAVS
jgi:hypothetical protein